MSTHRHHKHAAAVDPVTEDETRTFVATGYYPAHDRMNGGDITATGRHVHSIAEARADGKPVTIAVDPRVIPYGTILTISELPGLQFVAADTGGRIKNNHIDLSMSDRDECDTWGRREVRVTIVQIPPNSKPAKEHPHPHHHHRRGH